MPTRSSIAVSLANVSLLSSDTSTAVPTAVDLAPYFPVGRREVKFIIDIVPNSTALSETAVVTIQECASTATASFTNVLTYSGSTVTVTSTANSVATMTEFNAIVNYRYVRAIYTGATATGGSVGIVAIAFPQVRAA